MKAVILLFAFLNFALAKFSNNVPTITIAQDRSIDEIPEIRIAFPDGHEDTLVLRRHTNTDLDRLISKPNCNFIGSLKNDRKACVAVTGCPGQDMDFTINSEHNTLTNLYRLKTSGKVELVFNSHRGRTIGLRIPEHALNRNDEEEEYEEVDDEDDEEEDYEDDDDEDDEEENGDEEDDEEEYDEEDEMHPDGVDGDDGIFDSEDKKNEMEWAAICTSSNSSGCTETQSTNLLNLFIGYDDRFLNGFADKEEAEDYVSQVLTHVQANLCHESLGTKIIIKLGNIRHYEGESWSARQFGQKSELQKLGGKVHKKHDLVAFLCDPKRQGNYVGIAWIGSVCNWKGGWRLSISQKQGNILNTAGLLTHELGHNLGMYHDFDNSHKGRDCDGEGIMSYGEHPDVWSDCSRTDFLAHFNQILDSKRKNWCMPETDDICAV